MRVSDYIINFLIRRHINTIFMVTGGQAMFLNDAVYRNKSKIKPIFVHHEQAAGMAAEGYGKTSGTLGVAMVTAGPAAINVLNGVVGGWVDSSPMMIISGQSAFPNVQYMAKTGIRQCGLQGIYTEPVVKSITKYFITVDDPSHIAYYLEKAYYLATSGRTGPVWIEVPLDIQRMEVPEKLLNHFEPPEPPQNESIIDSATVKTVQLLQKSHRPLWLVGQGVRIAHAEAIFNSLLRHTNIPVVTSRLGIDLVDSGNPLFIGRPGLYADRSANFAVQLADLIICIGARLDPGLIGYDAGDWGRSATKIIVDIDEKELKKPGIANAIRLQSDAKEFLESLSHKLQKVKLPNYSLWRKKGTVLRQRYPTVHPDYAQEKPVNSYFLTQRISALAEATDAVVVDTSSPFHVVCQAWHIKKGQRLITTGGISTMGFWVAAIGVCMAKNKGRTIVITGDGCLQMNIQEFATIKHNNLPIKVFIINNNGYLLIRHTQVTHMENRLLGESPSTGLWCPDSMKIAKAYGIKAVKIRTPKEIDAKIREVLNHPGPVICDVHSPAWQAIIPRISSEKQKDGSMVSKPYEDLAPFLDRDEFARAMNIENG